MLSLTHVSIVYEEVLQIKLNKKTYNYVNSNLILSLVPLYPHRLSI